MAEENVKEQPQSAAPAEAEAVVVPEETQRVEEPTPSLEDTVKDVLRGELGSWQGGFADTFGRKTKELEQSVQHIVDSRLTQYEDRLNKDEEARVANLEPEDQTEYWKQRAMEKEQVAQAPQQPQAPEVSHHIQVLLNESKALMARYGVTGLNVSDPSLWGGFREGMSLKESLDVFEGNLQRRKSPPAATTPSPAPAPPQQTTPQTTQGAPQKTARTVNTLSDAATMFADGNINSTQYRDIKNQLKQGGSATL